MGGYEGLSDGGSFIISVEKLVREVHKQAGERATGPSKDQFTGG